MDLGDIATHVIAGRPPRRPTGSAQGHLVRLINPRDVSRTITPMSDLEEIEVASLDDVRVPLEAGDVVITSRGSVRAAVALPEHEGAIIGANLILVRLGDTLPPELLASYLRHPVTTAGLMSDFAGSSTAGFTVESLKRLRIQRTDRDCAAKLAELVRHVDLYSQYHLRAVQLHQEAAEEAVFQYFSAFGPYRL